MSPIHQVVEQLVTYREELVGWLQQDLEATLFSNRSFIRPAHLRQIPITETDAFFAFLRDQSPDDVRVRGATLANEGLGDQAVLRVGSTLRRFCHAHLEGELFELGREAADTYTRAFLEGFIKTRETIVLTEQERIRAALQRTLSRYTLQLQTAAEVARAASSILDRDRLLASSVDLIREGFDLYYVGLFLIDESGEWAILQAGTGKPGQEMMQRDHRLKIDDDSAVGWCIAHGKARIVADAGERASRLDKAFLPETRSEVALPLISRGQVIGAMTVQSRRTAAFSQEDSTMLQTVANHLASAIENARLYEAAQQEIAERRRAEEALKEYSERLEERVEQRTQELRDAQERLIRRERLAVLGQLAGGVGHELRNPLAVISNAVYYLGMVLSGADDTTREYLDIISSEVRNSEKIVSDLLDLSRTGHADREKIAVNELVAQVLKRRPPPEQVELTLEIASDLPSVFVDPRQIGQVLDNLIRNACDAMPEGGALVIRAAAGHDGQIALSIADSGCGISHENLPKIFEPLFTTKVKGIGLGLAVSRNLIAANGGKIEVESPSTVLQTGKGSTFTVIMPTKAAVR